MAWMSCRDSGGARCRLAICIAMSGVWFAAAGSAWADSARAIAAGGSHTCAIDVAGGAWCWGDNSLGQGGHALSTESGLPVPVAGFEDGVAEVVAGLRHTCLLTTAGAVFCWGANYSGELGNGTTTASSTPVAVSGLSAGVTAIFSGPSHTCAIDGGGVLRCWGYNMSGQIGGGALSYSTIPVSIDMPTSSVTSVAAGDSHTCALTTSGGVQCWGTDFSGELGDGRTMTGSSAPVDVVGLAGGVRAIAAGGGHTCALTTAGGLLCWGVNQYGELGNGTTTGSSVPIGVPGLESGVKGIAAGKRHTCAVTTDDVVLCWGENNAGKLGSVTGTNTSTVPVPVDDLTRRIATVSLGLEHSCVLSEEGGVLCWGSNRYGQNGIGTSGLSSVPKAVIGLSTGVAQVSAGGHFTCSLTVEGAALCWGSNWSGAVGDGTTTYRNSPVAVDGLGSGVAAVATGYNHACSLTAAGSVLCWGDNQYGQLGDGSTASSSVPRPVSGLSSGAAAVAAGEQHTCALTATGGVLCWGRNAYGQLGDGSTADSRFPIAVSGLTSSATAIAASGSHTCALESGGAVRCWGRGVEGQLGSGSLSHSSVPVAVGGLAESVTAIAAGYWHSCAITASGALRCWGQNSKGQAGDGTHDSPHVLPVTAAVPGSAAAVAAGDQHTCTATTAGAVLCWGSNDYRQLGDGTSRFDSALPVGVSGLGSGFVQVSAGQHHSCASTAQGAAWCWGKDYSGQLGDGYIGSYITPTPVIGFAGAASPVPVLAHPLLLVLSTGLLASGAACLHPSFRRRSRTG